MSGQRAKEYTEEFRNGLHGTTNTVDILAKPIHKYLQTNKTRIDQICKNFPTPWSFREAAKIVRGIIKEKMKVAKTAKFTYDWNSDLRLLYRILAIDSFRLDRAPRTGNPGYNVFETVPCSLLWSYYLDYNKIGFLKMRLCLKTDAKWFVETWGEPQQHQTLNSVMQDLWNQYETLYIKTKEEQWRQF